MQQLQKVGVEVWGHDFVTPEKVDAGLGARACTLEEGFEGADGVVIMNNHPRLPLGAGIPVLARGSGAPAVLFDSWSLFTAGDFSGSRACATARSGRPFEGS